MVPGLKVRSAIIQGQVSALHTIVQCIIDKIGEEERREVVSQLKQMLLSGYSIAGPATFSEEDNEVCNHAFTSLVMSFVDSIESDRH